MKHTLTLILMVTLTSCNFDANVTVTTNTPQTTTTSAPKNLPGSAVVRSMNPTSYWLPQTNLDDVVGPNNGSNGHIPDSASLDNQVFSVMVKFNPDVNQPDGGNQSWYQRLIEKGGYEATDGGWSIEWATNDVGPRNFVACLLWDQGNVTSRIQATMPNYSASGNIIVCTYDGQTHSMYLNGSLVGTQTIQFNSSSDSIGMGEASMVSGYQFAGTISDAAYWDKALSQSDVTKLEGM